MRHTGALIKDPGRPVTLDEGVFVQVRVAGTEVNGRAVVQEIESQHTKRTYPLLVFPDLVKALRPAHVRSETGGEYVQVTDLVKSTDGPFEHPPGSGVDAQFRAPLAVVLFTGLDIVDKRRVLVITQVIAPVADKPGIPLGGHAVVKIVFHNYLAGLGDQVLVGLDAVGRRSIPFVPARYRTVVDEASRGQAHIRMSAVGIAGAGGDWRCVIGAARGNPMLYLITALR